MCCSLFFYDFDSQTFVLLVILSFFDVFERNTFVLLIGIAKPLMGSRTLVFYWPPGILLELAAGKPFPWHFGRLAAVP